jgi:hypothetical protein
MSPSTTAQTTNKHHHHGDGAACPSSGVDLMKIHTVRVAGDPAEGLGEGTGQQNPVVTLKIN